MTGHGTWCSGLFFYSVTGWTWSSLRPFPTSKILWFCELQTQAGSEWVKLNLITWVHLGSWSSAVSSSCLQYSPEFPHYMVSALIKRGWNPTWFWWVYSEIPSSNSLNKELVTPVLAGASWGRQLFLLDSSKCCIDLKIPVWNTEGADQPQPQVCNCCCALCCVLRAQGHTQTCCNSTPFQIVHCSSLNHPKQQIHISA